MALGLFTLTALIVMASLSDELRTFSERGRGHLAERDARIAVFLCVFVGFLPASQQYMVRFTQDNLRVLAPLLGSRDAPLELPRPSFWRYILPGILVMPALAYGIDRDFSFYFRPVYFMQPTHIFQWTVGWFATINSALSIHLTLASSNALAERAKAISRIDLLDLSPLAPFARQTVQTMLVWFLMLSIFSVNAADPGFFMPLLMISSVVFTTSAVAAIRCNRTIHRRIQETKREQLTLVNAALRGDTSALANIALGPRGENAELTVADLLAYRRMIDETREWAFDSSAWLRAALYLALPLGSWLGGGLVERALDASLQ